jgi:hypothetical protein
MAAGTFTLFDSATLWEADGTGLFLPANPFALILATSAQVLTSAGQSLYADLTAELPTAGGYTAGGVALTGVTLTRAGAVTTFTFTGPTPKWTASGPGIAGWRYLAVYVAATLNGHVNPLVGYALGDAAPADVPATAAGQPLDVTANPSGLFTITHSP